MTKYVDAQNYVSEHYRLTNELQTRGEHMDPQERQDHEMAIRHCRRQVQKLLED